MGKRMTLTPTRWVRAERVLWLHHGGLAADTPVLDPEIVDDPSTDALATGPRSQASDYNPASIDTWYDGFDHDCAGNDDFDRDADTHRASSYANAGTCPPTSSWRWSWLWAAAATDCDDGRGGDPGP